MTGRVFVDTCTFINFAIVGQLSLLERTLAGRGLWTEVIQDEVVRASRTRPSLGSVNQWMPSPIQIWDAAAQASVFRLRRRVSEDPEDPHDSLGEAQCLHLLINEAQYADCMLLTDDSPASDFAAKQGISVIESADLLSQSFNMGLAGCPEAYDILVAMTEADEPRGVYLPPSHQYVC